MNYSKMVVCSHLRAKCWRAFLYPNLKGHKLRKVIIASCGVTKNLVDHPELDVIALDDLFLE